VPALGRRGSSTHLRTRLRMARSGPAGRRISSIGTLPVTPVTSHGVSWRWSSAGVSAESDQQPGDIDPVMCGGQQQRRAAVVVGPLQGGPGPQRDGHLVRVAGGRRVLQQTVGILRLPDVDRGLQGRRDGSPSPRPGMLDRCDAVAFRSWMTRCRP
jgi:hypothetical protein